MSICLPKSLAAVAASLLALGLAFVPGSLNAQTPAAAPVGEAAAPADPALWVVRDADSTIYLFGTVHLLRPGISWRAADVDAALASSDEVWLEIADVDDPSAAAPLIQRYGLAPADKPLSSLLTDADRAALDSAARSIGGSAAMFEPFRPWLAALQVSVAAVVRAGYDPASGVDPQIKAAAVAAGKPVKGLETMEQQFGFFAGLSDETQVAFLRQALDTYGDAPTELDRMVAAWASGDVEGLDRVVLAEMKADFPDVYKVLLIDRNADWTGQIETLLQGSGTTFIAVGAAHLAGEDSVQSMLAARGVAVERL